MKKYLFNLLFILAIFMMVNTSIAMDIQFPHNPAGNYGWYEPFRTKSTSELYDYLRNLAPNDLRTHLNSLTADQQENLYDRLNDCQMMILNHISNKAINSPNENMQAAPVVNEALSGFKAAGSARNSSKPGGYEISASSPALKQEVSAKENNQTGAGRAFKSHRLKSGAVVILGLFGSVLGYVIYKLCLKSKRANA